MLSIIIPAFNEEKMIPITAQRVSSIMKNAKINFEILFVDDGSSDGTWSAIEDVSKKYDGICGLHFSRNFGKEAAMFAGLESASGDCAVVIDCDLQHPPEKIVEMYRLWEDGFEVVEGIKSDRGEESGAHRLAANTFYKFISKATDIDMSNASDFKLLDRKVIDALNSMPERNVFFRALSYWAGFKKTSVSYEVQERAEGESKWSTKKLIKYAITNISSFSSMPLHIITYLGVVLLGISLIFTIITLVQKFTGTASDGFTTVIVLLLYGFSTIMISVGIIAYYIGKMYEEIKGRPRYIVSQKCGKVTK